MTNAAAVRSAWHELGYEQLESVDIAVLERALEVAERVLEAVGLVLEAAPE